MLANVKERMDIGLLWGKFVNIWGQVGVIISFIQFWSTIFILYSVTLSPNFHIPLWAYILGIITCAALALGFVLKWGISGYYRFFNQRSVLSEVDRKVNLIMSHLKIEDK